MAQLTFAQRDTFASSSSCSASSSYAPYDVFINHRGPDVKNTFAGHIYHRLKSRGLQVFLDRPELQTGHNIHDQIKAAIEVASVHIAIFSENYAESKWCLEELVLMLNSRGTILPVFYNVKPFELRWTEKGAYAGALQKHEEQQRHDLPTIGEWKKALSHVADISGFELEACNGDEVELVDKVVQRVLKEVPKPPLHVAKYKIGLQEKLEDFERTVLSQLEEEGRLEAKVLGIVGSGGIGKSTLAKQFFNNKRSNYNVSSFLFDVRENATRKSIEFLQSKLLKDLKEINTQIESWEEGIGILENNLKSCHALIILDDVDHISQLDALILPIKHVLDPKSLILVTSRDKHVLKSSRMVESSIYRLQGLNLLHSSELFCSHAFFQQHPPPEFEDLVDNFVKACDGLPLSLQVFGALLCQENDRSYWEEQLNGLRTLPLDIQVRLKISYDSLSPEEQQIFLDIACFSIGEDKDKWIRIWGWSGWKGSVGLRSLENKCLVEVSFANEIRMHDHLRDMGRDIAKEMMPRRLWKINDVYDLLEQSTSSVIQVRGIIMDDQKSTDTDPWEEGSFSDKEFKISKLQLLEAQGDLVRGILSKVRSPNLNLIWLRWKECPCSSLPSWIPMRDLRLLEVKGPKLERLWQRESQAPVQLRELYIDAPILEFPDSIRKLQNIEKIELPFAHLSALPEEFCDLRFLKYLDLNCCSLQFLPKYFGKLTNLQYIDLSECYKLQTLTDSFGDLTNLREINLQCCTSLEVLPDSLENLKNLLEINLQGCTSLEVLPDSLENLKNLREINLQGCTSLEVLPDSLENLKNLREIKLAGCKKLKMLPNSIVNLTELEEINLAGCESLEMLPNALGSLTNLQYIYLENCESLEQMPSNSLEKLLQLKHLHLTNCHRLTISDQIFGNITSLECLDLSGCIQMEVLPLQVLHQQHLRELNLLNTRIEELPSGPTVCLSNLEGLTLGSPLLKVLPPWLGYLTSLKELHLHGCKELNYLPDSVGQLAQLKELDITKCGIHYLPAAVMKMKNLKTLGVRDCPLCELPFKKAEDGEPSSAPGGELDFPMETGMIELNEMHLHCTEISKVTFPEGTCPKLHELKITQCHGLLEVGALPTTLLHLDLRGCDALRKIGGLCGLVNLQDLDIRGCCALEVEELLGLETEISLDLLRRKKLRSLKKLKTAFQSYDSDEEMETTVLHGDFCCHHGQQKEFCEACTFVKNFQRLVRKSRKRFFF